MMPVPADPHTRTRRFLLTLDSERAERVESIAAATVLHLKAQYTPPTGTTSEFWNVVATTKDGTHVSAAWHLSGYGDPTPGLPLKLSHTEAGHDPATADAMAEAVASGCRLKVVGAYMTERRDSYFLDERGQVRDAAVLVEAEGPAWQPWRPPHRREMPAGTFLVFYRGQLIGRASNPGGADRACRNHHWRPQPPEHGWKLTDTPAGRFWLPRPADDVAHRMRQASRAAEDLAETLDELARLDLSAAPDHARDLVAALVALGRGGLAERIARTAGVPVPRRGVTPLQSNAVLPHTDPRDEPWLAKPSSTSGSPRPTLRWSSRPTPSSATTSARASPSPCASSTTSLWRGR